jgi:hypothetical protein
VAYYARLLMVDPALDGLFCLRQSEADEWARHKLMQMGRGPF